MSVHLLHRFIFFLRTNVLINVLLVAAYFLFILFMHGHIVAAYLYIEKLVGMPHANLGVALIFVVAVASITYLLYSRLRNRWSEFVKPIGYLVVTLLAIIIHSRFMFDSNIEVIHAMEFSLLALLIFPLVNRYGFAILATVPFMLIDEAYQYLILYPEWNTFFEFNDVLMDIYGCAVLMCLLLIFGVGAYSAGSLHKRPELYLLLAGIALVLLLQQACIIANYAHETCSNTLLILNERTAPEPFWRWHGPRQIWYHVMSPPEALLTISAALLLYFGIDGFSKSDSNIVT